MAKATDLNVLRDMLTNAGVGHQREEDEDGPVVIIGEYDNWLMASPKGTECYTGFHAKFHFLPDGSLNKVGIWE